MTINSNTAPAAAFEIRDISRGFCNVALIENVTEITQPEDADGKPQKGYQWQEYTLHVPYRDNLADTISANTAAWLAEAKAADAAKLSAEIRAKRDKLLDASDKYLLDDVPTRASKADWKKYRQALRDIPETDGFPYAVTWPTPPEVQP